MKAEAFVLGRPGRKEEAQPALRIGAAKSGRWEVLRIKAPVCVLLTKWQKLGRTLAGR